MQAPIATHPFAKRYFLRPCISISYFHFFLLDSDTWNSRERRKEKSTDLRKPWLHSRTRWKKNSNISWNVLVFISKSKWEWRACVGIFTNSFLFVSLYLGQFVCRRNGADCRRSQVLVLPCSTNKWGFFDSQLVLLVLFLPLHHSDLSTPFPPVPVFSPLLFPAGLVPTAWW